MQMINKIKGTQIGGTVQVNGATYTKMFDGTFSLTSKSPFDTNMPSVNDMKSQSIGITPNMNQGGLKTYTENELIAMATIDLGQN